MRLIDADALEKDGWMMHRTIQVDKDTMSYQVKNPTDFPAVEPERKKGRWINHRNDEGHNIADCSYCGAAIQWFDDDDMPNFCCMCGADMREGVEQNGYR